MLSLLFVHFLVGSIFSFLGSCRYFSVLFVRVLVPGSSFLYVLVSLSLCSVPVVP